VQKRKRLNTFGVISTRASEYVQCTVDDDDDDDTYCNHDDDDNNNNINDDDEIYSV